MKNLFLVLSAIILSIFNCSAQLKRTPHITYNDTATIKIIAENITDTVNVRSNYWSYLLYMVHNYDEVKIAKPGVYYIKHALAKPGYCNFFEQDFQLFIIPGDTTVVKLSTKTDENKKTTANFETTDPINKYYQANRKKSNSSNPFYRFYDPNKESINISEYVEASKIADSIIKQNQQFLDSYSSSLPDWFYKTEKINISYGFAIQFLQLYLRLDEGARNLIPMSKVELKNPEAILSEQYYDFVYEYLYINCRVLDNKLNNTALVINNIERQSNLMDSILDGEMKDYFITCRLSGLYPAAKTLEDIKIADNFIKTNYPKLPETNLKFIDSRRNEMMKTIKTGLQKGDKAPNFYLKDANGKQYNLSNFTGKVIYLNFWKTDCEPFIKEIPNLSKIKSKLAGKPVEIVNICMDNNPEKWKQIIEKEKLTGINLICAGNWETKLKEFYFIEELPHYALIDKNGLIVSNKCNGPVDVYSELIKVVNN